MRTSRERADALKSQWEQEKKLITELRDTKKQLEDLQLEIERAERAADYARAAELKYGKQTELTAKLQEQEQALAKRDGAQRLLKEEVDADDIARIVSAWTGIPVTRLMEGEQAKLIRMEEELHKRVVGQDEAVAAVADAVRRARAGLKDPRRPIGSFIFLGPTGVGKTELARALAAFLFDDEQALTRIDMSEYMEKFSVSRLIGAPPGYVGYEEGGQLTEAVRRRPYQVILLDEIEKAHSDVFNILLQVLDDGRLTDGQGRTVDFRNTVIVMTSNVGSQVISSYAGERDDASYEQMKTQVTEMLRTVFRPEFLNRVDEIIVFHSLTDADLARIVDLLLADLSRRLGEHDLELEITEAARRLIAAEGHDPAFGARPLRRAIQRLVENPLARALLEGRFKPGTRIKVDADPVSGTLLFTDGGTTVVTSTADERRDVRGTDSGAGSRERAERAPVGAGQPESDSTNSPQVDDTAAWMTARIEPQPLPPGAPRWKRTPVTRRSSRSYARRSSVTAPITFARFMELALYAPGHGYYATNDARATRAGDFLTAPELHPIFGWTVARQIHEMWLRLGEPAEFTLREYGAGTGRLGEQIREGLRPGWLAARQIDALRADRGRRQAHGAEPSAAPIVGRSCWATSSWTRCPSIGSSMTAVGCASCTSAGVTINSSS